jgi:hypothetical protein
VPNNPPREEGATPSGPAEESGARWKPLSVSYRVDAADRIVATGGDWERAALEGGAPQLRQVQQTQLFDWIADPELSQLWQLLLAEARAGSRTLVLRLACDAPALRRRVELGLTPSPDGSVTFTSVELERTPRPTVSLLEEEASRDATLPPLPLCSWCARAQTDGEWVSLEQASARLGLFEQELLPPLQHTICADCAAAVRADLRGA